MSSLLIWIRPSLCRGRVNLNNLKADRTIIVRIHHGLKWTKDVHLSMRALVKESARAGWHVWFIQQVTVGQEPLHNTSPIDLLANIPLEFHPFVHSFTAEDLHALYPHAHKYMQEGYSGYTTERGDYMGMANFLRRFPAYKFAFVIEYDVRWLGDWGKFFSQTLHIALHTMNKGHKHQRLHISDVPDLVMFSDALYDFLPPDGPSNGVRDDPHWKFPQVFKEMISVFGISQKTVKEIHEQSVLGNAGYIEEFLPSLAAYRNLTVVIVPLGEWDNDMALHCCSHINEAIYNEWVVSGQCHFFTMLHPIKNHDPAIWEGRPEEFFTGLPSL